MSVNADASETSLAYSTADTGRSLSSAVSVEVLPVRTHAGADPHLFGVRVEDAPDLAGREVVLMRDGGGYWFELRAISVRGIARRVEPPGEGGALEWYTVEPRRILAWDYATIRTV